LFAHYLALAAVWISFSDAVLELFVDGRRPDGRVANVQGWFFVLVTAAASFPACSEAGIADSKRYVDGLLTGREALQVESASMRAIL
jgi:hypothetical protein